MSDSLEQVRRDLKQVRREVYRYLCRKDARQHNVLLVGKSGAGKSAMLNTLTKAICGGEYIARSPVGEGVTQSKTLQLIGFKNCGLTEDDMYESTDDEDSIRMLIPLLPHIYDAAGLGDTDSEEFSELFQLLLGGYIPPGTNIPGLAKIQEEKGVGYLSIEYKTPKPDWKITKVVFVQSGTDAVPQNLIGCLRSVIHPVDCASANKYTGDVFVVVTKVDRVSSESNFETIGKIEEKSSDENTPIQFDEVVATIAKAFSIKGALEHNLLRWKSYCDDVGYDDETIDLQALQLLKKLVMPGRPIQPPLHPSSPWTDIELAFWTAIRWLQNVKVNLLSVLIFLAITVCFIASLIVYL